MTDAMTHRGPNDRGTYLARRRRPRRAAPEHRRRRGRPPAVRQRDGTIWAIQNGELYNHGDPRAARASGHRFASRCDTEILPHLYERVRRSAFRRSCAACSASRSGTDARRRAVIARDRLGIKPLYYAARRRPARLRLGAQEPARQRPRPTGARLRGDRRVSDLRIRPGPLTGDYGATGAAPAVPDGQAEHAAKMDRKRCPVLLVQIGQNLGVAPAGNEWPLARAGLGSTRGCRARRSRSYPQTVQL